MKPMTPSKKTNDRPAFALVVTLTLMVLLSILALGLLSLSSVELRRSGTSDAQARARTNAKLAMMMALGELQREMGPDRRISAPGRRLLEEDSTSATANWTGVYDAWTEDTGTDIVEKRPTPTFRRWLISGEESVVTAETSATNGTDPASKTVELTAATPTSDPSQGGSCSDTRWSLRMVDRRSEHQGETRRVRRTSPPTPPKPLAQMQATPRSNHGVFLGTGADSNPNLEKIFSVATTGLLNGKPEELLHDVTTESTGLLTNVRNGGFRKDLSFLLERPWSEANDKTLLPPLYTASGQPGINLRELWLYYNIWGEYRYGAPTHADGGSIPASAPYLLQSANAREARDDPFYAYTFLTKLETRFVFSLLV